MIRNTFVLKMTGDRAAAVEAVRALKPEFEKAGMDNFSVWHMEQYLFGYGEDGDAARLAGAFEKLPEGV